MQTKSQLTPPIAAAQIMGDLGHNVSVEEAKQMYPIWKKNLATQMPEDDFVSVFCQYF